MPVQYSLPDPFLLEGASIQVQNMILSRHHAAIPMHTHGSNCWEIHYIPTGHGTLHTGGQSYDLLPGTLYITGPHIEHAQSPDPADPMLEYCLYLRIRQPEGSPALHAFCAAPFRFAQDDGSVHALLRRLFDEMEHRRTGYALCAQLIISDLLLQLSRGCEAPGQSRSTAPASPAADANTLLIEECFLYEYATITLPALAARLGLSPRQTQRLLRETYASTFRRMKNEAQLSAAVTLLRGTDRSITGISVELGFSSPEHFANAFRKAYGMSPRAYRSAAKQG